MALRRLRALHATQDYSERARCRHAPVCVQEVRRQHGLDHVDVLTMYSCRNPSKHVDRADYEESTGNLVRHRNLCDPDSTPEVELISAYAHGAAYSPSRVRYLLVMWCARRHRPFTIVEDPEFQELMRMLYAKVQLPSRVTVSRDVRLVQVEAKIRVITFLTVRRPCPLGFRMLTVTVGHGLQDPHLCGWLDVPECDLVLGCHGSLTSKRRNRAHHSRLYPVSFTFLCYQGFTSTNELLTG